MTVKIVPSIAPDHRAMKTEITKSERKFSYLSDARTKWELIKCDPKTCSGIFTESRQNKERQ